MCTCQISQDSYNNNFSVFIFIITVTTKIPTWLAASCVPFPLPPLVAFSIHLLSVDFFVLIFPFVGPPLLFAAAQFRLRVGPFAPLVRP